MLRQIHSYGGHGFVRVPSAALYNLTSSRKIIDVIQAIKDDSTKSNVKRATLSAKKKERVKLPDYDDARVGKMCHISEFLSHPTGVEAMLNVNALENYMCLDANTYRCRIPSIKLLNFVVAPVLDLQVNPTSEGCTVELLSCKLEGSDIVESQNKYFSASMKNFMAWEENGSETYLDVDVKLKIILETSIRGFEPRICFNCQISKLAICPEEDTINSEILDRPFTLLPVSAVEGPGNLVIQALLDRFIPILLQQLLRDYDTWVKKRRRSLP